MIFRFTRTFLAALVLSAQFAAAVDFDAEIRPFLDQNCVSCHGPDKQKSDFRVDTLDADFLNGGDVDLWQEVLDLVNVSEMPPDDAKSMPSDDERSAFSEALTALMRRALEAQRSTGGQNVLRRLTAYEYNNTLRDLLGLDLRYATPLPPEGVAHEGFQNNVTVLGTSALHLEYFESIARSSLSRIILIPEEQPEPYFVRVEPELAEQKSSRKGGAKQRELDKESVTYTISPGEDYTGPNKAVFVAEYGEKHETGILLAGNRPDDPMNRPFDDDQKKGGTKGDGRSGYQPEFRVEIDATSPREYLTLMYELIALALQTDSTRVVTFQTASEEVGIADRFPSALGITKGAHGLSHGKKEFEEEARYIEFLNEMHANFIQRLDSIQEGESTLLDNTLCFYGCATSKTHRAVNYPIILSGGSNLGFQHGSHLGFDEERIPLANLFVTIANQLGTPTEKFAGSTGDITEVLV